MPVALLSDSELEDESLDDETSSEDGVASAAAVDVEASGAAVVVVDDAEPSVLAAVSARRVFLALARASFLSSF